MKFSKLVIKIIFLFTTCVFIACQKVYEPFDSNIKNNLNFSPQKPEIIKSDSLIDIREYGDLLRNDKNFMDESIYKDILNDPALTAVTREFGNSIINIKSLPLKSKVAKSIITPWSSWWFPKNDKFIFEDIIIKNQKTNKTLLSPLSKYDLYQKFKTSKKSSAADFERKLFNQNAKDWEGLCDAWSIASLLIPEPIHSVSVNLAKNNITHKMTQLTFEISDLKALLLKTFEAVEDTSFKYYGQKFTGDETGWIYPDIFPEQFHRFLETQLFEKQKPFIMDTDPGLEIWNVPVFKANYTMTSIPNEPNSVFVRTWIYSAESIKDYLNKSYIGTKEAVREYDYVLEGEPNNNGELVIHSGYWVLGPDGIDSRHNHPDYFVLVPDLKQVNRKSWNSEIDIQLVDELLEKSFH